MSVDPQTAKYTHTHQGTTWYFCSEHCRQQFAEHPTEETLSSEEMGAPSEAVSPRRFSVGREVLVAVGIFAMLVAIIVVGRNIVIQKNTAQSATVVGAAADNVASDAGEGNVFVSAEYDREARSASTVTFSLSLNTHIVDLKDFAPLAQVKLHANGSVSEPIAVQETSETSPHHKNYTISFPDPGASQVTLSVHDVAGVSERQLPFNI